MPKPPRVTYDLDSLDGGGPEQQRPDFWTLPKHLAGPAMVAMAKQVQTDQLDREQQMLRQAVLHENQWLGSLYGLARPRKESRIGPWNICKAATRTAKSMICRSPVKVRIDTSGAFGSTQRLAKEGTRWLYGVFEENRVATHVAPDVFTDAGVLDLGVTVVRVVKKRIRIDKWFPWEVFIPEMETLYGFEHASQAVLLRWMPKHEAIAEFAGEKKSKEEKAIVEAIEDCNEYNEVFEGTVSQRAIPVWWGWAKNGAHVVSTSQKTLFHRDWKYDFLPIVPWYVERPLAGLFGEGFVQTLMGYQCEIYGFNDAIEEHIRLMANKKIIFENGSGITEDEWDNEIASLHTKNKGAASPEIWGPDVDQLVKGLMEARQESYQAGLNEIGMNQWSIAAQEPAERSGRGMEIARDKERGRLLTAGNQYEQGHVDVAQVCLMLGKETSGTPVNGRLPSDKELEPVDFADLSELIEKYPWRVRKTPVSALPDSPDERRQVVEKWVEIGLVTAEVGQSLLDLLDVDAESDLFGAAREEIMAVIEDILVKGEKGYSPPHPMQNLELGMRMMAAAAAKARRQKVEEEKSDLMEQWIDEARLLLKPATPVSPEIRPGVGEQPQAAPLPNRLPVPGEATPVPGAEATGPNGELLPPEGAPPVPAV